VDILQKFGIFAPGAQSGRQIHLIKYINEHGKIITQPLHSARQGIATDF
jgi:hypothetical protein